MACQLTAFNPLNAELNPISHLLALLDAHHIPHVSRIRVKLSLINIPYAKFCQYSTPCYQQRDFESRVIPDKQGANRIFV